MEPVTSTEDDPLELYDALVMAGDRPDPAAFAARYPKAPDLLSRIEGLERLRADFDDAVAARGASADAPETVAGLRVVHALGEGGMGAVYVAEAPDGQRFAVKLLKRTSEVAARRFAREAAVAMELSHPGIATVHRSGVEDGRPYIVSELVPGQSLRQVLASRAPPCPDGPLGHAALARQLAEALGHAHASGVVHRDVKPANVIVTPEGRARLIDFGVARLVDDDERITLTGAFVGTAAYAAPEQREGRREDIGPWTDTFSLGVTLFEMLTGRLAPSPRRALWSGSRRPRRLNRLVPRTLDGVVARALAWDPKRRFADGAELAAALEEAMRR